MDGETLKPEKDWSKEADDVIPAAIKLAESDLHAGLDKLLTLEKQTRQSADLASSKRTLAAILDVCKSAGKWTLLIEQMTFLSKKHGQLKQAIAAMVQHVISLLDQTPDEHTKVAVLEAIRSVTEGKIFVEVERARVTRELAKIKEPTDLASAAEILCELQVETYGAMDTREKTDFILEQIRLCIAQSDFNQARILSRKITPRYFGSAVTSADDKELTRQRLCYYNFMVQIDLHDSDYLNVCRHYYSIFHTKEVADDPHQYSSALQNVVVFVILSPYSNEQSDLIFRIQAESKLEELPQCLQAIKMFTASELMSWPLVQQLAEPLFAGTSIVPAKDLIKDLHKRVIEHNIRIVSKCYTRISMDRLHSLLDLSHSEIESYLSEMVVSGSVFARINRPERIVSFTKAKDTDDILNDWSHKISSLLGHIETIEHLITKEEMINAL
ncbi:hypothetical protein CANCADRAFT_31025 [Tortispora caseinolytica NRRL Y-17796]|uniref:PCI domain-containing protein n=1 Tax=Tortispora caseinolytica NRRL Y-17796 TaxID=767744 RepID=A0A1E4TDW0_9ASCO|nr:hypothetical protein CANCADRAFT_31025 [Tortispora caseinolytica NRRL Y-17796]